MVVGSKAAQGASDQRPLMRRVGHPGAQQAAAGRRWASRAPTPTGSRRFAASALLPVIAACVVDMDVFASEFVIRAWREGLRVMEIPIQLHEKRQPSIHLFRRVPNVLKNVAQARLRHPRRGRVSVARWLASPSTSTRCRTTAASRAARVAAGRARAGARLLAGRAPVPGAVRAGWRAGDVLRHRRGPEAGRGRRAALRARTGGRGGGHPQPRPRLRADARAPERSREDLGARTQALAAAAGARRWASARRATPSAPRCYGGAASGLPLRLVRVPRRAVLGSPRRR